jgi:hypothetical protein
MAVLVAFEHAQCPKLIQPAHRLARRSDGETQGAGYGDNAAEAEAPTSVLSVLSVLSVFSVVRLYFRF